MENVIVLNIGWTQIEFNTDLNSVYEKAGLHDKGLYQICGRHHAYGQDALLYIGKTRDSFWQRLPNRWEFVESSSQPKTIRIGRFMCPKPGSKYELGWNLTEWDAMIDIAERLLIRAHSPAMNKQGTTGLFLDEELKASTAPSKEPASHYLILNWYDYGNLLPEVSTFRNSYRFWEYDTIVETEKIVDSRE